RLLGPSIFNGPALGSTDCRSVDNPHSLGITTHTFLHPDLRVGRSSWWTRERAEVRGDFQPTLAGIAGREEAAKGRKCDGGAAVSAVGSVHGKAMVTLEELGPRLCVLASVRWGGGS